MLMGVKYPTFLHIKSIQVTTQLIFQFYLLVFLTDDYQYIFFNHQ